MTGWIAPEAFSAFVRDRHAVLLRFAHVLSGDRHLAEDLVQDALERTGLAWRRVERQDDPEAYVRRIITNQFLNRVRSLRRERLTAEMPESPASEQVPTDHQTWRLLAELPRQQRAALVLRYYLDLSEAQTAELLGCSIGTVKSNASRALAKLRARLATTTESVR